MVVKIYNASNVMEAQVVSNILMENEIPSYYQNASEGILAHDVSGFGLFGVDVYVNDRDAEKAAQIIEEYKDAVRQK